jgi:hypothetical protein
MMERLENLAARLIAMAVSLVGDAGPVRKAMACSEYDFETIAPVARYQTKFERLVELIVREQGNLIAANRALLAEIREKPKHVPGG